MYPFLRSHIGCLRKHSHVDFELHDFDVLPKWSGGEHFSILDVGVVI
jgi:hypothetical protein